MVRFEVKEVVSGHISESLPVMWRVVRQPDLSVRKPILPTYGMDGGPTGGGTSEETVVLIQEREGGNICPRVDDVGMQRSGCRLKILGR